MIPNLLDRLYRFETGAPKRRLLAYTVVFGASFAYLGLNIGVARRSEGFVIFESVVLALILSIILPATLGTLNRQPERRIPDSQGKVTEIPRENLLSKFVFGGVAIAFAVAAVSFLGEGVSALIALRTLAALSADAFNSFIAIRDLLAGAALGKLLWDRIKPYVGK